MRGETVQPIVTFPELRATMARHGVTQNDLAELLENSPHTVGKKINALAEFTFNDMVEIKEYFRRKGEANVTIDLLFFDWNFTKVK